MPAGNPLLQSRVKETLRPASPSGDVILRVWAHHHRQAVDGGLAARTDRHDLVLVGRSSLQQPRPCPAAASSCRSHALRELVPAAMNRRLLPGRRCRATSRKVRGGDSPAALAASLREQDYCAVALVQFLDGSLLMKSMGDIPFGRGFDQACRDPGRMTDGLHPVCSLISVGDARLLQAGQEPLPLPC